MRGCKFRIRRGFQSTPPSRVATMRGCKFRIRRGFQSTPPSRVATGCYVQPLQISWRISIHTTLAGGDTRFSAGRCSTKNYFNPHHPRGWRRLRRVFLTKQTDFNPHHPRGWRPPADKIEPPGYLTFQSTPPSRVATVCGQCVSSAPRISIHTTLAGGDQCCCI